MDKEKNRLVVFRNKAIRRILVDEEWFFSVVAALTDSANPRDYWFKMKQRMKADDGSSEIFLPDEMLPGLIADTEES